MFVCGGRRRRGIWEKKGERQGEKSKGKSASINNQVTPGALQSLELPQRDAERVRNCFGESLTFKKPSKSGGIKKKPTPPFKGGVNHPRTLFIEESDLISAFIL